MDGSDVSRLPHVLNSQPPQFLAPQEDNGLFSSLNLPSQRRIKQIWAIGGGKGGVGKSLIASSLAISVSRLGNRVIAIDLDLGGANLHTTLGMDLPRHTLSDFFAGRVTSLESCVVPSCVPYLHMISGAQDAVGVANISSLQKRLLLESALRLDADYLVFDLGAGTMLNTIDFFLCGDLGLITILPEPTSIENAYRFIKTAYLRHLRSAPSLAGVRRLVDLAMDTQNPQAIKTPADLFQAVNREDPEAGVAMKREISRFRPKLIVNQARTQTDIDIGHSVKSVCKKYFGIEMDYVGYLDYDSYVWQAVRRKRPLMLEFPNSRLVSSIDRITRDLIKTAGDFRNERMVPPK